MSRSIRLKNSLKNRGKVFGTDGVRGLSNRYPMDSETALSLGRAVAHVLKHSGRRNRIVIGKDTRLSGYMLETALASGIVSAGTDVMLVGPLPTPGVSFITRSMLADAGVVISGSHNDYRDNGIKFFDRDGFKLSDETESRIEEEMTTGLLRQQEGVGAEQIGKAYRIDDAKGRTIQFLKGTFPRSLRLDGVKVVIDCANGAGYDVAPHVFRELGATVTAIFDDPDGMNINVRCGSLHPETLSKRVLESGADFGVALDGDADRVILCDDKGEVADGDLLMALCASHFHKKGWLKKGTLVATVMSNHGLDRLMGEIGVRVLRTQVGDRYVVEQMQAGGFNLGGEQSGHLIFLDHNTTGDGILGALQVASILMESGKPLSELRKIWVPLPQVLVNVVVKEKRPFSELPKVDAAIRAVEKELGENGRVLVRYSGTENICRIMVEGESQDRIRRLAEMIAESFGS